MHSNCVYVCVCHCECVRLVSARSRSGMATLMSRCHWGVVTCGGGVRTLWATPGAFSSDHNSSPRVTMATRSSSSEHQATEQPLVTVLSLERNRDTLKWIETHNYITSGKKKKKRRFKKLYCCQSPGYEVMWSWRQLSQSAHQSGDDSGGCANSSRCGGRWGDLKQHRLQRLETGSDEAHRAARVTWHRQVLSQHPHLKGKQVRCYFMSGFGTFYCWVWYFTILQCMGKNAEIGENETLWVLYRIQNTQKIIHDPALCRHSFITTCV